MANGCLRDDQPHSSQHNPIAHEILRIGQIVNATISGYPYYANIVHSLCGENVLVSFPNQTNTGSYLYSRKNVLPYHTQFPVEKFMPLKFIKKEII